MMSVLRSLIIVLSFCVAFAAVGEAQECLLFDEYLRTTGALTIPGSSWSVALHGDNLLLGGYGVTLVDVSDPHAMVVVEAAPFDGSAVYDMCTHGDLGFYVDYHEFVVVDLSTPGLATEIGSHASGATSKLCVDGDRAYCAGSFLHIFDVSDPTTPLPLHDSMIIGYPNDMVAGGGYLYTVHSTEGLSIYDVSDPSAPTLVGELDEPAEGEQLVVAGDYAFVLSTVPGLVVVDISDPANPSLETTVPLPPEDYMAGDAYLDGDRLYLSRAGGMHVFDVSDPTAPDPLGALGSTRGAYRVVASGNRAFVAGYYSGTIVSYDVSAPYSAPLAGGLDPAGTSFDVALSGDVALVANSDIEIYGISDPANPTLLATLGLGCCASSVHTIDTFAYVLDGEFQTLRVVDISDPSSPQIGVDTLSTVIGNDIVFDGNRAYIPANWSGVTVLDITDRSAPSLLANIDIVSASSLCVAGNLAYVAAGFQGLQIIDVTDPTTPSIVGSHPIDYFVNSMDICRVDACVVLANDWRGLATVDVSDPSDPQLLGETTMPYPATDIELDGRIAYVSSDTTGIQILDLQDPAAPVFIGTIHMRGVPSNMDIGTHLTAVAVGSEGVDFFANPCGIVPVLLQDMSVTAEASLVDIDWRVVDDGYVFRLVRIRGGRETVVPYAQVAHNAYTALDDLGAAEPGETIVYRLELDAGDGGWTPIADKSLTLEGAAPRSFILSARPNPFNPTTTIRYAIDRPGDYRLNVYDAAGRLVAVLAGRAHTPGLHDATWDGRDLAGRGVASGTYFVGLAGEGGQDMKKVMLVR